METLITMKVTPRALKLVRMIAALTDEKHYEVLDRLLIKELARLNPKIQAMKTTKRGR
jgi:hypothetical protein